jgi:hypothetical protein
MAWSMSPTAVRLRSASTSCLSSWYCLVGVLVLVDEGVGEPLAVLLDDVVVLGQ